MKRKENYKLCASVSSLILFALWTFLVRVVDLHKIGQSNTAVGFATFNGMVHDFLGVNIILYNLTDILSVIPIGVAAGFAILGLCQLIRRRSIGKVDTSILLLGGFYILVIGVFLFFEIVVINYRPVLIEGKLEASYPSSTTLLVTCIMSTALMQLLWRIKSKTVKIILSVAIISFTVFMVVARIISGVHWASDIIGGLLISTALVFLYSWAVESFDRNFRKSIDREVKKNYNK